MPMFLVWVTLYCHQQKPHCGTRKSQLAHGFLQGTPFRKVGGLFSHKQDSPIPFQYFNKTLRFFHMGGWRSQKALFFFIWVVGGPRKRLRVNVPFPLDLCILSFSRGIESESPKTHLHAPGLLQQAAMLGITGQRIDLHATYALGVEVANTHINIWTNGIIFQQPRFPWNFQGFPFTKPQFGVRIVWGRFHLTEIWTNAKYDASCFAIMGIRRCSASGKWC